MCAQLVSPANGHTEISVYIVYIYLQIYFNWCLQFLRVCVVEIVIAHLKASLLARHGGFNNCLHFKWKRTLIGAEKEDGAWGAGRGLGSWPAGCGTLHVALYHINCAHEILICKSFSTTLRACSTGCFLSIAQICGTATFPAPNMESL